MITNRDDSDSRDGNSSSNNNENGGIKKKRPRVGDVRSTNNDNARPITDRESDSYSSNYRSSSYGGDGYNSDRNRERGEYNGNRRSSYGNDDRRQQGGGGYNNNNNGGGYNNNRGGYGNNNGGRYNNNGGGYNNNNNRRPQYGNNNQNRQGGGGGGNRRPSNRPPMPRNENQKIIDRPKRLIKPVKYKENVDPSTPLRLNKYLANAGVCSRREADTYIEAGEVMVNGVVISELGAKVTRADKVEFRGKEVQLESKIYVLLNKPKNCVTTSDDPQNRKTVMDLVKNACTERIYPVGRLDRNTTGVLLLTNDGDLASKLMHPKFKKKKIYQVSLDKDVAIEHMQAIADGITLDDGEIHADSIAYVSEDTLNEVGIEIHSGRNRIVRRIFETLGYQVTKLDRVYFVGLTKKDLPRGRWRYLTEQEVNMLRMGAFE